MQRKPYGGGRPLRWLRQLCGSTTDDDEESVTRVWRTGTGVWAGTDRERGQG